MAMVIVFGVDIYLDGKMNKLITWKQARHYLN